MVLHFFSYLLLYKEKHAAVLFVCEYSLWNILTGTFGACLQETLFQQLSTPCVHAFLTGTLLHFSF